MNLDIPERDISARLYLNTDQQIVFNKVMDAITEGTGRMFFLDGPGGSGKTLL
ncbi:hypothetical protein BC829DRAFT_406812, partial [Chytridium lagenaria]